MSEPSKTPHLSDKAKRVIRTAIAGFISGALTVLLAAQSNFASMNWDAVRVLGVAAVFGGLTAAWAAIHNYILDPSNIPSLSVDPPGPTAVDHPAETDSK